MKHHCTVAMQEYELSFPENLLYVGSHFEEACWVQDQCLLCFTEADLIKQLHQSLQAYTT